VEDVRLGGVVGVVALLVEDEGNDGSWLLAVDELAAADKEASSASDVEEDDADRADGDGEEAVDSWAKAAVGDELDCDSVATAEVPASAEAEVEAECDWPACWDGLVPSASSTSSSSSSSSSSDSSSSPSSSDLSPSSSSSL